jgi:nitronate monooxygenase
MAGGPTTPALVVAAGRAGSIGFLAAGYKSVDAVAAELDVLGSSGLPYGINLFVPSPQPPDPNALERYRVELQSEADRYGVDLPPLRLHDDDAFDAKARLTVDASPPLVSFTFGIPPQRLVRALKSAGSTVLVTVTDAEEAQAGVAVGADALVVQGGEAGAHSATTRPDRYTGTRRVRDVLREVQGAVDVPLVAAGGVGTAADVAALLDAGAVAVQAGTRFLAADEAGTRPAHLAALLAGNGRPTVVTRAFTGQPARALRNRFTDAYSPTAPIGYPAIHHLTVPIRAAAARQGDTEALNLWAGTGYRHVRRGTTAQILDQLDPRT